MNERIQELAEQADILFSPSRVPETGYEYLGAEITMGDLEKFAQSLIEDVMACINEELLDQHRHSYESENHYIRTWAKIECLDEVLYTIRRRYAQEER